jgi:uncharacterized GH25 family protein
MTLPCLRICCALLLALLGKGALAHEFWVLPDRFASPAGSAVRLSLAVGENFQGEPVAFSTALVAALQHFSAGGTRSDLRPHVPAEPKAEFVLSLPRAGAHLLALDTHPSEVVLEAGKFHAYLREEGLEAVIAAREAGGTAQTPGRERYRRHIKSLLLAGAASDGTALVRTGQRLEILPLADPLKRRPGQDLGFQVLFEGKPLAQALVKFWHRRGSQTLVVRTRSDAEGRVTVTPPWSGTWMASVVHMVPATDSPKHDWDSHWGNLTFSLPR